jgi:hypothetical protein
MAGGRIELGSIDHEQPFGLRTLAKRRGQRLGMRARSKREARKIAALGAAANTEAALARLQPLRLSIAGALQQAGSLRKAAELLNEQRVESRMGGR